MQAAENGGNVAVVGLVSDTHGVLDSATIDALKGRATDAIIHAGDVGDKHKKLRLSAAQIIQRLEESTRNTRIIAVAGNVDEGVSDLPLTQVVTMAGVRILVMHICGFPPKVSQDSQELIDTISPQIVVFGHSHVPGVQWHNNILYVNPGSAGPRRFKLPRCIAFLSLHASGIVEVEFTPVATLPQDLEGLPQPLIQNMARCGSV